MELSSTDLAKLVQDSKAEPNLRFSVHRISRKGEEVFYTVCLWAYRAPVILTASRKSICDEWTFTVGKSAKKEEREKMKPLIQKDPGTL